MKKTAIGSPDNEERRPEDRTEEERPQSTEDYIFQLDTYRQAVSELKTEVDQLKAQNTAGLAKIKLVNLTFDTPENRMSELTRIPRNLVFRLVYQIELEAMNDRDRDPLTTPLSTIRRMAFFKLMRSVDGQHLIRAGMLAEKELNVVEGEVGEEEKW